MENDTFSQGRWRTWWSGGGGGAFNVKSLKLEVYSGKFLQVTVNFEVDPRCMKIFHLAVSTRIAVSNGTKSKNYKDR